MITELHAWERSPCAGGVVFRDPDRVAWIRIRPRLAGFPRLPQLLAAISAGAAAGDAPPPTTVITEEGEIAVVACTGEAIVAVAGADPYLCIDGVGPADNRQLAIALIRQLGAGLGFRRRRPFVYQPLPGWLGLRRPGVTHWLHPRFPRSPFRAAVFDARPAADPAVDRLERFLFARFAGELDALEDRGLTDVESNHGLGGRMRTVRGLAADGAPRLRLAVAATDGDFTYLASLEGPEHPSATAALEQLFASFRPIPRPVEGGASASWNL